MDTNIPSHKHNLVSTASVFVYITVGFHSTEMHRRFDAPAGEQHCSRRFASGHPRDKAVTPRQAGADGTECLCSPASSSGGSRAEFRGKKHHVSIDHRGQILSCTQLFQCNGVSKFRAISLGAFVSSCLGQN